MGVGDDDRIASEQRRVRLRSSIARTCELLGSAVLSNADNTLVRERYTSGALSERALFSLVWQCVATAALFAWTDARPALKLAPSYAAHGRWSAFLQRVRQAHQGELRAALSLFDGVFVSESLVEELSSWTIADESLAAISDVLSADRDWLAMDSIELLLALDDVRAGRLAPREDSWETPGSYDARSVVSTSRSVCEFAASAAISRLSIELAARPETLARPAVIVADPRCGCGALLLCAARELARRLEYDRARADEALGSIIATSLRGADRDPVRVALARLGLWLEAPSALDAAALRGCVRALDPLDLHGRSALFESEEPRICLALTDARSDTEAAIEQARATLRSDDWLCALVAPTLAWMTDLSPLRLQVMRDFEPEPVLFEPEVEGSSGALASAGNAVVLLARRVAAREVSWSHRWRTSFAHGTEGERALLARLQRFGCCDDQLARGLQLRKPNAYEPAAVCLWRENGRLTVTGSAAAHDPTAVVLWATPGSLAARAMVAWFHASVVRWQFETLTRLRGRKQAPLTVEEVLELVSPTIARLDRWDELILFGAEIEQRGCTLATLAKIDEIAASSLSLEPEEQRRAFASQRAIELAAAATVAGESAVREAPSREDQPSPLAPDALLAPAMPDGGAPPVALVAPSAGRDEALSRTTGSSQRGPLAPRMDAGEAARGRGTEGALRGRSSDGRAAPVASKRSVDQPGDDAEREAYAIACAAGAEGIPLRELVRRGREHTEDELRDAIDALVAGGWVSVSDDEVQRVCSTRASRER